MKIKFSDILATLAKLTAPPPPRRITKTHLAAMRRGRARAARARGLAARAKVEERLKNERAASGRGRRPIKGAMLSAMEPGRWYGRTDLANLIGRGREARAAANMFLKRGWLTRVRNQGSRNITPQEAMAGVDAEPEWLYTLSEEGEKERARLLGEPLPHGL